MIYPCIVFRNGKWYEAGADVPETNEGVIPTSKVEVEVAPIVVEQEAEKPQYTIKQINKMKADEVKALAIELEFDAEALEDMSATEIKRNIISFLKLQ